MVNPFLTAKVHDVDTAFLLEKAVVSDIRNAVAYTDGKQIFMNTDDNLEKLLPAYDPVRMKKWLLWHEKLHIELRHHNRFFRYLSEIKEAEAENKFHLTKSEVNIIMDILVHDKERDTYPELVETAEKNLAQMRDRNSLLCTFTTYTLEEMLDEYAKFKEELKDLLPPSKDKGDDQENGDEQGESQDDQSENTEDKDGQSESKDSKGKSKDSKGKDSKDDTSEATSSSAGTSGESKDKPTNKQSETSDTDTTDTNTAKSERHSEADWSKLDDIDDKEFISDREASEILRHVNKIKNTKIKLARLTQTLNGLVTTTKIRSYKTPNYAQTGQRTIMKGQKAGKASLYLCFDATGSMGTELALFKDIIQKAIPQALKTPTMWFSGLPTGTSSSEFKTKFRDTKTKTKAYYHDNDLYNATFKDMLDVTAWSGYSDDGDRTIELCWLAEQKGYTPIGITDGGHDYSPTWSTKYAKELKRTILVGHYGRWLRSVKDINPRVQIISLDPDDKE